MDIETIHESLVNGQRRQMVEQIDEYGATDFFAEYKEYLGDCFDKYSWFTDATTSYFRIKAR